MMKSAGSALGEDIGSLIEEKIRGIVVDESEGLGFQAKRRSLRNLHGSRHQIDIVVEDQHDRPIILIEPKYLRYTKHNWDKGGRLVAGHYNLRKSYRSIRKSVAVLAGNWTSTSVVFLESFGVEIHRIPFETIAGVLREYDVPFAWSEKDKKTPSIALKRFRRLPKSTKQEIGNRIVTGIETKLRESIRSTLSLDPSAARSIEHVEVLIKTQHGEFYLSSFQNVNTAIEYLLRLQRDVPDLKAILGEQAT